MSAFSVAMRYFPYVFHPITVLGVGILVLIHQEWRLQDGYRDELLRRVGGFVGVGLVSLVPTVAYFLLVGGSVIRATQGNSWRMDALVASGLVIASVGTWALWRRRGWGSLVPRAMQALLAVAVPYAALSPFWNVSGHVMIALMPTLFLTLVDRKFWPSLAVPVVMVPNRIYLDAHTWAQSVGGFLLAGVIVLGLYWVQTGGSLRPEPRSTAH